MGWLVDGRPLIAAPPAPACRGTDDDIEAALWKPHILHPDPDVPGAFWGYVPGPLREFPHVVPDADFRRIPESLYFGFGPLDHRTRRLCGCDFPDRILLDEAAALRLFERYGRAWDDAREDRDRLIAAGGPRVSFAWEDLGGAFGPGGHVPAYGVQPPVPYEDLRFLGLSWPCTPEQLSQRRRALAMQHHSDRGGDDTMMVRINNAYDRVAKAIKAQSAA